MKQQKKHQSPKTIAIRDIKQELSKEGKCFITFRVELNAPIKEIIREYLEEQKEVHHG